VNLSGTSNAGGNSVYAQKVYDRSDLFVGYRHVSMLYRTSGGNVAMDYDLIHDIVEQRTGEAEPLDADRDEVNAGDLLMIL
jgi:hypothetical protein